MTHSISQASTVRHPDRKASPATGSTSATNFVRKEPAAGDRRNFGAVDADPNAGNGVGGYNRLAHRSAASAVGFAHGPNQIPDNPMQESPSLISLRQESRSLMSSLSSMRNPALRQHGATFYTHRGEAALVRTGTGGDAEILVNGKPAFACFNDAYSPGNVHVMMADPAGRMYAGRYLPGNYLAEASRLVNAAQNAVSGSGNVQSQLRRWGN